MNNYYDLLEISHSASEDVIRAAYKAKVKLWHPDNFTEEKKKQQATIKLQEINKALEVLTDSKKRKDYDETLNESEKQTQKSKAHEPNPDPVEEKYAQALEQARNMILMTTSEAEYLQLHRKIHQSDYPKQEKELMHRALDFLTLARLNKELEKESSKKIYKDKVRSQKNEIIGVILIGFILTIWSINVWWIAIIIAVLNYLKGKEARNDLKEAEQAEERLQKYRSNGFQI